MEEEKKYMKMELLSKKEQQLKDLENSQPIYIAKNPVYKRTLRVWPNNHLIRRLVGI